jgi:hypothetical protein
LKFGASLRERDTIFEWLRKGNKSGWSSEQTAERLYDLLRPDAVEIRLHPTWLARLVKNKTPVETHQVPYPGMLLEENARALASKYDTLVYKLGIYLNNVTIVPDAGLSQTAFHFRLTKPPANARLEGLKPGRNPRQRDLEPHSPSLASGPPALGSGEREAMHRPPVQLKGARPGLKPLAVYSNITGRRASV